jgi:protein CpxP
MPNQTNRPSHAALAIGLGIAVFGAPLGIAGAGEPAGSTEFRLAQGAPQGAPKAGPPQRGAPQAQAPAQQGGNQPIERQITELRKRLNITPQQQPQFDAFAQAMRQNTQSMEAMMQEQQTPNRSAVDDLKAAAKFAEAEADGLKRLLPPLQALYESLSDQQKKAADQVLASAASSDQPPPPPQGKKR